MHYFSHISVESMAYVQLGFQFVNEFVHNLRRRYNVYIQRYLNVVWTSYLRRILACVFWMLVYVVVNVGWTLFERCNYVVLWRAYFECWFNVVWTSSKQRCLNVVITSCPNVSLNVVTTFLRVHKKKLTQRQSRRCLDVRRTLIQRCYNVIVLAGDKPKRLNFARVARHMTVLWILITIIQSIFTTITLQELVSHTYLSVFQGVVTLLKSTIKINKQ